MTIAAFFILVPIVMAFSLRRGPSTVASPVPPRLERYIGEALDYYSRGREGGL